MDRAGEDKATQNENYADSLRALKHDINNQLSNIYLAVEQLKYELPDANEDCTFYIDSINISANKINTLLKEAE
jgi:sensor histidine kinase regulating citrate/malate metabolism